MADASVSQGAEPKVAGLPLHLLDGEGLKRVLRVIGDVGDFWKTHGLTVGLLSLGTTVALFAISYRLLEGGTAWTDVDLLACLAFAVLLFALATVTGLEANRVDQRAADRAAQVFRVEAEAYVALHTRAAESVKDAAGRATTRTDGTSVRL